MQIHETKSTGLVTEMLRALPAVGGMAVILGPHGAGKTWAVRKACEDLPRLVLTRPMPGTASSTPRSFFAEVAADLELPVSRQTGASELARMIRTTVVERGLTLVLDHCEMLRDSQLPYLRYLVDQLDHVAVIGSIPFRMRLCQHPALAVRVRLPIEVNGVELMELQKIHGQEFAADWLRESHEITKGLWGPLTTLMQAQRQRCVHIGSTALDATAEDARRIAERFLVREAA